MLSKIVDALNRADEHRGGPQGFLRPIDVDRIARTLELAVIGESNGRLNLPSSTSTVFDAVEQKIVQEIQSEWSWQGSEFVNQLRAYADRLIGFSVEAELQRLQLIARNTLSRLSAANHTVEGELGPLRDFFVDTRNELKTFRNKHKLDRPARIPSGRWATFGLLFVLIALESVLNGFFFAKGSEYGILGGIGTAVGISVVNVLFAFLVGLGPTRWINHRYVLIKASGVAALLTGIAILIALHLFGTHFRSATAIGGEDHAMPKALESLLSTPLSFPDMASVYLFGLGVLFALGALWKGYSFDDPYPTYGAQWRRFQRALDDYRDEHAAHFDQLDVIKEETIKDLDRGIAQIPKYPQQAAKIRAQRSSILQMFENYEREIEAAVNRLLAEYRATNRQHRTDPPPAHFEQLWRLPYSMLRTDDAKVLTSETEQAPISIAQALDELRALSCQVLQEYEKLLVQYPHATQIE